PRARRAEPPPCGRPHRRRSAHRRLRLRTRRRGWRDALAQGARARPAGGVRRHRADRTDRGDLRLRPGARGQGGPLADGGRRLPRLHDRLALEALAHAAGDALARRIVPYGTLFDGDVVFAVSTATAAPATPLQTEALAALAVPMAVERAVRLARGLRDIPGLADKGGR